MLHDIVEDFAGSQDGRFTEQFKAGDQVELSEYLAGIVVPAGLAKPVKAEIVIENKAIVSDPVGTEAPKRGRKAKAE